MSDERPMEEAAQSAKSTQGSHDGRRTRSLLAGVFWLLASVMVVAATIAPWAHQTLLISGGWGAIAGDVIEREDVNQAIAVIGVERLSDALDVDQIVADALPGPAFISGALTDIVQRRVADAVAGVIAMDAFKTAFVRANEVAHAATMKVIRGGDSEALTSDAGQITLSILPLLEAGFAALQEAGIIDASRQLPDLSPDIGTIVLVESDKLETVQTVIRWFDLITILSLLLWALFTGLAIWLSERRLRMVAWLSAGALVALIVVRLIARVLLESVIRRQPQLEARVVVKAFVDAAVDSLLWFSFVLIVVAVVIGVAALLVERRQRLEEQRLVAAAEV